jgi:hypothetical protein
VERILADVDADCGNGFKATAVVWHGMLLILVAPNQLCGARRVHSITRHRGELNPAAQQSPAVSRCAILSVGCTGGTGQ